MTDQGSILIEFRRHQPGGDIELCAYLFDEQTGQRLFHAPMSAVYVENIRTLLTADLDVLKAACIDAKWKAGRGAY